MTELNNKLVPNILLLKTDNKYNNGGPIVNMFDEGGYDTLDEEELLERLNILPEVIIEGYAPLRLTTYYPFVSEYPFTGHSTLDIPIDRNTWKNYPGDLLLSRWISSDRISPYLTIDKDSSADDYNLITNNCADATLNYLNKAFGTNESPNLFTTPGDVRDYAINQLHGKVINNNDGSDTVLIPRNANNARKLSTTALDMYADGDLRGDAIMKYRGPFNYTRPYVNRKSEGGELSKPLEWDKLSIRERAAYIRDAVSRGIFDIDNIRLEYNEFKKGGNTLNPPLKYIYDELPRLLREAGLDVKVSSGYRRAGAVGTAGNRSWHPRHGAVDIVPLGNTTFEDIEYALHNNPAIRLYMLSNNFGLLDESGRTPESRATMHRTGATGPHFHIGRDSKPAALYRLRVGALLPTGDRRVVYFTNPSLPLAEPEQVIEPTVVEPLGIDNSIPSLVLELKTVPEELTVYEQEIPEVVVTPERKLYIRPDQMLAQMNEMVTPYTPIEYNTLRSPSVTDRLALINSNRVTLLLKDLEDAIVRNNLLGIQNPDKLRRDVLDIRFYRNMSALGGNLFSGEENHSSQMNIFRRPNGEYFYQASPESEEIPVTPLNTMFENPALWTYTDANGKLYTPRQTATTNQGTVVKKENEGPIVEAAKNYLGELQYDINNDIPIGGKYTMPAIAAAAALPIIGEAAAPILANPYVDAGITSAFAGHGLNHAINEGIDGLGDAAMTALEVAPLGRLVKPMFNAGDAALFELLTKHPLIKLPISKSSKVSSETLANLKDTPWYQEVSKEFGEDVANLAVLKLQTPGFFEWFYGENPQEALLHMDRFANLRDIINKITGNIDEGKAAIAGSGAGIALGHFDRAGAALHDLDVTAYMSNPSRTTNPSEAFIDNLSLFNFDRLSQSPIFLTIREAYPEAFKNAKVTRTSKLLKALEGLNRWWNNDFKYGKVLPNPFPDSYKEGVFNITPMFNISNLGANRVAMTRINGEPIDIFLSDRYVPTVGNSVSADNVLGWKRAFIDKYEKAGRTPRAKDIKDIENYVPFSEGNPVINAEGQSLYAPFSFKKSTLIDDLGVPVLAPIETYPGSNQYVPSFMNFKGEFRPLYRDYLTGADKTLKALGGNLFPKGGPMIKVNPGDRVFTDLCALWSNSLLRDNGYLINGNAWNLNNVDTVFNGYEGLERPENYDLPLVKLYNHSATDNVFKNFDSKILDVNKPYVVNMFYNNSPSLEEAYNNGKGVTGTHTGVLTFDPDTNRWWVTHNIHGNIHLEPFVSLLNGKGKYGVTAIYAPRKDTLWNRAKGLLGFADGGLMNPIEYMHLRFPVTELLDIHPLFDSGFTPRDIGDFGDIEYMLARYDNLPYYNNYSKPDSLKGKSVIVYNDRLGEGTNEAIALDALSHGLRELDSIWRELYIPTLLTAFREDANYFADLEGIPLEYRQEYIDGFIDGKIRDMVVKDSLRKLLNYLPKQSLILEYRSMTPELLNALTEAYSYIFPTLLDEIIVNGKRK